MASRPRQVPPPLPIDTGQSSNLPPSSSVDPPPPPSSNPPPPSSTPPDSQPPTPPSSQPPPSSSPPPSSTQPPPSSSTPPPSSSAPQSQPDASSTPPLPLPSNTLPPDTSSLLPTSTDTFTTSFTTIVSTRGDGSTFTTTSALPTSLISATPKPGRSSNRVGIVAGTTAAGIIVLLILLGIVFAYRRNKLQKLWDEVALLSSSARRRERKGLLEDEDFDDNLGGGSGGMRMYRDMSGSSAGGISGSGGGHSRGPSGTGSGFSSYPLNNLGTSNTAYDPPSNPFNLSPNFASSTPTTHGAASIHTRTSSHSPAPSILRPHTSDSGSIFREELGDDDEDDIGSPYTDPFAGHSIHGSATSLVPAAVTTTLATTTRAGSTTPPANNGAEPRPHSRVSPPSSPSANQIRSSTPLIAIPIRTGTATPDRETRTISMTSSNTTPIRRLPTPGSSSSSGPGPLPPSYSAGPPPTQTTPTPPHAPPTFPTPHTNTVFNNNTLTSAGTGTSASMYSTSGTSARTSEFGFRSRGSTPPVPALPPASLPPQAQYQGQQQQQQQGRGKTGGLPPGAAPSITPGSNVYTTTTKSSYSSLNSQSSDVSDTSGSASMYSQASALYSTYSYYPPSQTQFRMSPTEIEGGSSFNVGGGEREVSAPTYSHGPTAAAGLSGPKVLRAPSPTMGVKSDSFGHDYWNSGGGDEREFSAQMYSQGQYGPGPPPATAAAGSSGLKIPTSQPKKSSPLARALSTDAKILGRGL